MDYNWIILIIIILFFLFKIYVKVTYKFWSYQPVFHYYNLLYWIKPKGIINKELPKSNKFCNFYNIKTKEFSEFDENTINEIVTFIKTYYYRSDEAEYMPTNLSFSSYLIGNNDKTLISTYYRSTTIINNDSFIADKELIGVMTTRPVNITLKNITTFRANYVDHLCVHYEHRNKGIAPELIQTHAYNTRHINNKIYVSLFKREGELTGIVPLTTYNTYQFNILEMPQNKFLHASMQILEINKLNIQLLITLITNKKTKFDCFIIPDFSNLLNLINNNTYVIYGIIENDILIAAYFFRDSNMYYKSYIKNNKKEEKEKEKKDKAIECFATINNCNYNEIFIKGFYLALEKYSKKIKANLVTIENTGNTNIIIDNIFLLNIISLIISPTAYFYYNYVKRPILSEKTIILC